MRIVGIQLFSHGASGSLADVEDTSSLRRNIGQAGLDNFLVCEPASYHGRRSSGFKTEFLLRSTF